MTGKDLTLLVATPFWISYVSECLARGLPDDNIMKHLMQDDALEREQAKALIKASLRRLKVEGLDREQERGLALVRLGFLYRSMVEKRDYKGAHAVEQTRISLLKLTEVNPTLRFVDPAERQKSIDLIRETEGKGEELHEALGTLMNNFKIIKDELDEVAAKNAKRAGGTAGPVGGDKASHTTAAGQEIRP